jgi:hypothetical protein
MAEPNELPERIQKDLEEALRHGGVDKLPKRASRPRRRFRLGIADPRPKSPGQLVLFAVALFTVAYLLPVPFKAQLLLTSFLLVAVAMVTHLANPNPSGPRRWRDRYVTLPPTSWQERLYRFVYRQS